MLSRRSSGFTLVELVLVVLVISVLAAFAIPNFRTNYVRAKVYSTKTSMHRVLMAAEAYADQHQGRYPATPDDLAAYAMQQPDYANLKNAYSHQNIWINLNRRLAGDISFHPILNTDGIAVGYRIEARGTQDWLPSVLERRPRDDTF
jgi:prepilin-type N-terminal cleavage/methylation domain-containing protein